MCNFGALEKIILQRIRDEGGEMVRKDLTTALIAMQYTRGMVNMAYGRIERTGAGLVEFTNRNKRIRLTEEGWEHLDRIGG